MEEIRVDENRIFKLTKAIPCETLQEGLLQTLSEDDRIFATYQIKNGYYGWTLPDGEWSRLSDADALDRIDVERELSLRRESISRSPGVTDVLVANLFTVPDESFIFYRSLPGGGVRVMLAGWDYKYPADPVSKVGGDRTRKKERQRVILLFKEAGAPVPGFEFVVKTGSGRDKSFRCNEEGLCVFGSLAPGTRFQLRGLTVPMQSDLLVEAGREVYEFDVTRIVDIVVNVMLDDSPAPDKSVLVEYGGEERNLTTDAQGRAVVKVPFMGGRNISVKVDDRTLTREIVPSDNIFDFSFQTPPPVVPEEPVIREEEPPVNLPRTFSPHVLVLGIDDVPCKRFPLFVTIAGTRTRYVSDDGAKVFPGQAVEGQKMLVVSELNEANREEFVLDADKEEYIFRVPYKISPSDCDVEVLVVDSRERPVTNASINFEQDGHATRCYLEQDGRVWINSADYEMEKNIRTVLTAYDKEYETLDFHLTEGEKSYVIQVEKPSKPYLKWLQVLVLILTAVLMYFVMDLYLDVLI